jgi:hypothetical protein
MKKILLQTVTACGLLLAFSSCKKDETQAVLNVAAAPQLTASATTATLTAATATTTAVTYTWKPADFGFSAAVTYTLQFAKTGTNFAITQDFTTDNTVTNNTLTKVITVGDLNAVYRALYSPLVTVATPLEVRIKATVGDKAVTSYSNVTTISARPY